MTSISARTCMTIAACVFPVAHCSAIDPIVWANTGEDKVAREDVRTTQGSVINSAWDGTGVRVWGARNEVVSFNLVLDAPSAPLTGVSVSFDTLTGPGGYVIQSQPTTGNGVFDWTQRPIELFYVRYLQIKGVGRLVYEHYDERHVPERFRRPWSGQGSALPGTGWTDRPDHDQYYPDIAVPMELHPTFAIAQGQSQAVWADIYIPNNAPAGEYSGFITVQADGQLAQTIPVSMEVMSFALSDEPTLKTMLVLGYEDVNNRYAGIEYPFDPVIVEQMRQVRDKHFQLAHRHRISLIDADIPPERQGDPTNASSEWAARFDGSLFTAANGYAGPGAGVGNNIYSIALYGGWWNAYPNITQAEMWARTDGWADWFAANAPGAEYFLYIVDELSDPVSLAKISLWSSWIESNPGSGSAVQTFATMGYITGVTSAPALDIPCATAYNATAQEVQVAADTILADPNKKLWWYNGARPYTGTFATEDDGVALRASAWGFFKKDIMRWFFWESTYYNNFQGAAGQTNVFQSAFTFGVDDHFDPELGRTGWNYSNGDGVLFYPGTDTVYPAESYNIDGPIASLRLKHWRRGIQDADYLAMARAIDPVATDALVQAMLPKTHWEYGVSDPNDPTWILTDISWQTDADVWETARKELACIIDQTVCACAADCDGSGSLNILDYICFGDAYATQQPLADCDGNGLFNILDYICFGDAYAAGCP